jgi:uncharacterized protein Veg
MIADWNMLVNKRLSLEGEFGNDEGYFETLTFESGNERTFVKNSYVPKVYPAMGIILNDTIIKESGKTEYQEFESWYNETLRYGIISFYFPRIGFIRKPDTLRGEIGIYKFLPTEMKYEGKGIKFATFGIKETGFIAERKRKLLLTENEIYLLTENGRRFLH